jgi:hypothetical protein
MPDRSYRNLIKTAAGPIWIFMRPLFRGASLLLVFLCAPDYFQVSREKVRLMSLSTDGPRDGEISVLELPPSTLRIAIRIAVILTGLALVVSFTVLAFLSPVATPKMALAACVGIGSDATRLACYDQLAHEALPPPAKGAYAPVRVPDADAGHS